MIVRGINMIINGIDFEIVFNIKKIKRIYIRIKKIENKYYLIINANKKLKEKELKELIDRNPKVIDRLLKNVESTNLISNDEILILGKKYKKEESKKIIEEGYQEIINLFNKYKIIFNKNDVLLKFRKMKSRWGVCHITKNYISLTSYLIHVPMELIEYVIIHEFCHFKYHNHSKSFYSYVSEYCPDYKKRVKELKSYTSLLI